MAKHKTRGKLPLQINSKSYLAISVVGDFLEECITVNRTVSLIQNLCSETTFAKMTFGVVLECVFCVFQLDFRFFSFKVC